MTIYKVADSAAITLRNCFNNICDLQSHSLINFFFCLTGCSVTILAYLDPVQLEPLWCFCAKVSVLLLVWSKLKGSHLGFLDWQIKRGGCLKSRLAPQWGCTVSSYNSWNHSLGTRWLPFNQFAFFIHSPRFKAAKLLARSFCRKLF